MWGPQCPPGDHRPHECPPERTPAGRPAPVCPPFATVATYSIDRAAANDACSPLSQSPLDSRSDTITQMGLESQKFGGMCRCNEKNLPSHSALHDQHFSNSAGQPVRARPSANACVDSCDRLRPRSPWHGQERAYEACKLSQIGRVSQRKQRC